MRRLANSLNVMTTVEMNCDKIYPERMASTILLQRYKAYVRSIKMTGMLYVNLITSSESKPELTFYDFGPGLKLSQSVVEHTLREDLPAVWRIKYAIGTLTMNVQLPNMIMLATQLMTRGSIHIR